MERTSKLAAEVVSAETSMATANATSANATAAAQTATAAAESKSTTLAKSKSAAAEQCTITTQAITLLRDFVLRFRKEPVGKTQWT